MLNLRITNGIRSAALIGRLRGSVLLGQSLPAVARSHAKHHPHFASPGLCFAKPLFGLANRRLQPVTLYEMATKLLDYMLTNNKIFDIILD